MICLFCLSDSLPVTKYIRIGIGDKNETLVYNISTFDPNISETSVGVNKNNELPTMSPIERQECKSTIILWIFYHLILS